MLSVMTLSRRNAEVEITDQHFSTHYPLVEFVKTMSLPIGWVSQNNTKHNDDLLNIVYIWLCDSHPALT